MAGRGSTELGIGLITYNRLMALMGCVERVQRFTAMPFSLVVADDGSDDGSIPWVREHGLTVITGHRRGCAWNKNRALYYFLERSPCDPILLLEDDCWPEEAGWEQAWVAAAEQWGHVNHAWARPDLIAAGSGTPADPYWCREFGGSCTISTRAALAEVGYLDTRFHGWGIEHVEWTWRFGRFLAERWQGPPGTYPCLQSGVHLAQFGSWCNHEEAARNRQWLDVLLREPSYRPPWRTPEEEAVVRAEQAGI